MIYKFKKNLANDDYAYKMMLESVNRLLQENKIPTEARTDIRSKQGLVFIEKFPYKNHLKEIATLKKIPGVMKVRKGQMVLKDGNVIFVVSVHFDGIEVLKHYLKPEDEIVFYEDDEPEEKKAKAAAENKTQETFIL